MYSQKSALVVDLDHSLIKTDILHEQFLILLKKNPALLFYLPLILFRGKLALKEFLNERAPIEPHHLPYNEEVLKVVKKYRAEGHRTLLVSASLQSIVAQVAGHLGLFDGAHGSQGTNLKGSQKLQFLKNDLKLTNFAYVGDHDVDRILWNESQDIIMVNPRPSLAEKVAKENQSKNKTIQTIETTKPWLRSFFKGIRIHQWVKNILVFVPMILSHEFASVEKWTHSVLAFLLFSLTASSIYIINDLLDLGSDRLHPKKRLRPWAHGDLSIPQGLIVFLLFLVVALSTALSFDREAGVLLITYFILNVLYSFKLKSQLIIDVILLAIMYDFRILFGGLMTGIPISPWLLTFSIFFFLGLAFVKRYSELKRHGESSKNNSRAYEAGDLPIIANIGVTSSLLSILIFALYLNSQVAQNLYRHPTYLWLITPALLYWLGRVWILSYRGTIDDDTVAFAIKDKISYATGLFIFSIILLSI